MRELNLIRRLEILKETYVDANMVYELYPIGKTAARKIVNDISEDLKRRGVPLLQSKRKYIPLGEVLKRYPIDEKRLQK